MGWRFLATRLDGVGGESLIDPELPLDDVSITHVLSGTASITAKIPYDVRRLMGADGGPILVPWSTAIYAEKDGEIRAGAIVNDLDSDGTYLSIKAIGFTGYLKNIPYMEDYSGYNLDPMRVALMVWNHAQKASRGNLGLICTITESPVRIGKRGHPALRGRPDIKDDQGNIVLPAQPPVPAQKDEPFQLSWYQTSDLDKVFSELADITPFDYLEQHSWLDAETCQILHTLEMRYPTISRRRDDLRFVLGENIIAPPKLQEDGDEYASEILALGSGEGSAMVNAIATDNSQGRLRRVSVLTKKEVADKTTLSAHARNELRYLQGGASFDELLILNTPSAPYGDLRVGDMIYVQPGKGWYEKVDQWVRVVEIEVRPDDNDNMRVLVLAGNSD